ncbi:F-box/LRR-repeat protein 14 [Spatholobus suberectus]|nr:F-box/LRR-repeat protein 14 [Spatholobus suberectus]
MSGGTCCKRGTFKRFKHAPMHFHLPNGQQCPSLLDLCIRKITQSQEIEIHKHDTFSALPPDLSQRIFNKLVYSCYLTPASLQAFRDCALQDIYLGEYGGAAVDDAWMDVVSSQGSSLLHLDLSGSDVTDHGLTYVRDCKNVISLNLDHCHQIADRGLECISGLCNLASLSFRRNDAISAQGLNNISGLVNLVKLDLERCPGIHGGLVHLQGWILYAMLESLNIKWCNCIVDVDMKPLSVLTNLKSLEISFSKVTDFGISFLKRLQKLALLNLEGCHVTAACLDSLAELPALSNLNLSRCNLSNDGCEKFSRLENLTVLNLGFNDITDACLAHLQAGLTKLKSLNLDSCRIEDEGLVHLAGHQQLNCLELSDTEIGSNGLHYLSGLSSLEKLNLSFTMVNDSGLSKLCGLSSLKSLNLDARQVTDAGLASLTSLTGLTELDLFGARITDFGTNYLKCFNNLRLLEICGGGLTDDGVKNIKEILSLTCLNLSQNCNLTDTTLELISGLPGLISLNVSNSCITNAGLQHLKTLKNLRSLSLESCKVTANDIRKLQSTDLSNLTSVKYGKTTSN